MDWLTFTRAHLVLNVFHEPILDEWAIWEQRGRWDGVPGYRWIVGTSVWHQALWSWTELLDTDPGPLDAHVP